MSLIDELIARQKRAAQEMAEANAAILEFYQETTDRLYAENAKPLAQLAAKTASVPTRAPLVPDWSKAPEWARHWTVDEDGRATWFELRPTPYGRGGWSGILRGWWIDTNNGQYKHDAMYEAPSRWRETCCSRQLPYPDWENAPAWAKFWATSENGHAYWYELEPRFFPDEPRWIPNRTAARIAVAGLHGATPDWRYTLTQRPKSK